MNMVPPKGQMPTKGAVAEDDHVHLTMSFEDDGQDEGLDEATASRPDTGDERGEANAGRPGGANAGGPGGAGPAGSARSRPTRNARDDEQREKSGRGGILPQFADIELALTVEVGSLNIPLKELMAVEPGQLLALDRMTSEPVNVLVNGKPFARGEIVAVGDRYGVRLLEIVSGSGGAG